MFGQSKTRNAHKLHRGDQVTDQNGKVLGTVDKVDTVTEDKGTPDQVIRNTVHYTDGRSFPINSDQFCTDELYVK